MPRISLALYSCRRFPVGVWTSSHCRPGRSVGPTTVASAMVQGLLLVRAV